LKIKKSKSVVPILALYLTVGFIQV
jgi:hypothetical protein